MAKVTVICTVKNEAVSIRSFLDALLSQSSPADEIIITDGGSIDGTVEVIREYIGRGAPIKLIVAPGNRSVGRNVAIANASYDIIASTDAGSQVDKDWLRNIAAPFEDATIDVVAGLSVPLATNFLEECISRVVLPSAEQMERMETPFPSARCMAFRKAAWRKVGGFPEEFSLNEDAPFNFALKDAGCRYYFARDAVVYWRPQPTLRQLFKHQYDFARGDGQGMLYKSYYPRRALLYFSTLIGSILLLIFAPAFLWLILVGIVLYIALRIQRFHQIKDKRKYLLIPLIRFLIDMAHFSGYPRGLLDRWRNPTRFVRGKETRFTGTMKMLDLGCGRRKMPGAIGVDFNLNSDADIIYNLNVFPYPFPDNAFDLIHCDGILEHLDDIVQVMEELHRIAKPGAKVGIIAPYFTSVDAFTDPTHKRFFSARSFDYFTGDFPEYGFYSNARFRRVKVEILFWKLPRLGGLHIQHLVGAHWLANRLTSVYERFFAYLLPAQKIRYELIVVKD